MKVVVMIPALNEGPTIGNVINLIPRNMADRVNVLVVDDGSTDGTFEESKKAGADEIISFKTNMGLAYAFKKGLEKALSMDADIIVNIDADGQYDPKEIPELIAPIIDGKADIVLGSRFKGTIEYMPKRKRIGNLISTKITSYLSSLSISDAQTGFRALSREAAFLLNIMSGFTYTQEMIIQASNKNLRIVEVPCKFLKRKEGKSRLISSLFKYALRSGTTILRTNLDYKPLRTFLLTGSAVSILGFLVGLRVFLNFLLTGSVSPYIPSAILTAVLLIIGFQIMLLGLIADMVGRERKIVEDVLYKLKKKDLESEKS